MNNVLLKHLYSVISKVLLAQTDHIKENFEKADKIIIWIVGFSIGIFVLIISQNTNNEFIVNLTFEISVFSLLVVIAGLLFRIFSFFTQMLYTGIVISFATFAESISSSPEIPISREIKTNDSVERIIEFLKDDFNFEVKKIDLSKMTDEAKNGYRDALINYYNILADSNDVKKQLNEYKTNFANYFGFSKKYLDKRMDNADFMKRRGKNYQIMIWISYILFFLTIGIFIAGVSTVLYELVRNNCG